MSRRCPKCDVYDLDEATIYFHKHVHEEEGAKTYTGLTTVPYLAMPAIGKVLTTLGSELIDWLLSKVARGDGCLTGDCPHGSQRESVESLLADFWDEMKGDG